MRSLPQILVLCVVAVALAACGGSSPRRDEARESTANAPHIQVKAPSFDDADPHVWQTRSPFQYAVHGIDISRFQTQIDWDAARAGGVNFVYMKATEGGDLVDPAFRENWRGAARAGVARGAYHFHYHCRPAAEQARWFIKHVPKSAGALPPVLDMEWTPFSPTCTLRPPAADVRREAVIFMDAIEAHYGQRPLLYTSIDFYRENELWRLPRTEFWLRSVAGHPGDKYEGQSWTFWQYTSTGLVPGIAGKVDINVFAGSPGTWAQWLAARAQ
ncbi:MAG: GH25 family lysozyme [Paracoccaceae bacterium]